MFILSLFSTPLEILLESNPEISFFLLFSTKLADCEGGSGGNEDSGEEKSVFLSGLKFPDLEIYLKSLKME